MNRLIIAGSPRTDGRSAALANQLFEACIEDCPQDEVALAPVATLAIEGCQGCGGCRRWAAENADEEQGVSAGVCAGKGMGADSFAYETPSLDAGEGSCAKGRGGLPAFEGDDDGFRCYLEDDMQDLYPLIEAADELVVVSPVYFAGPPAQLKALLDRLQPYYWIRQRGKRGGPKRPATLHVVGEGGDPHGFEPLVGTVRSALACAGFALESVYDWVGKINEDGEITAEAAAYPLASSWKASMTEDPSSALSGYAYKSSSAPGGREHACPPLAPLPGTCKKKAAEASGDTLQPTSPAPQSSLQAVSRKGSASPAKHDRPLLRLSEEKPASPSQGKAKQQARKSNSQSKHSNSGQNHSQGGGRQAAKHMQGKRSGDKQIAKRAQGKQSNGKQLNGNRSNDKLSKGKQSSGEQPTGKQAKGKRRG